MDMSTASLLWSVVFSAIGLGYFLYGKKQQYLPALICGLILMFYPYFISNTYVLFVVGVVISAVPYFWRE